MSTTTLRTIEIEIPNDLAARMNALSLEDKNQFAVAAIADAIRKREARERGLTEIQRSAKPSEQCFADLRAKSGGPDLSHLPPEELDEFGLKAIEEMDPVMQAEFFEQEKPN